MRLGRGGPAELPPRERLRGGSHRPGLATWIYTGTALVPHGTQILSLILRSGPGVYHRRRRVLCIGEGARAARMRSHGCPASGAGRGLLPGRAERHSKRRVLVDTGVMFLDCPAYLDKHGAARCGLPAEVEDRYAARSPDGPLECARTRCPRGHQFNATIESLTWHKHSGATAPAATATNFA